MRAGRTTNLASVISLLGAFVATAMVMGLLAAGVAIPAVGAVGTAARSGIDVFDALPESFTATPLSQQSRILAADGSLLATPYDENRVIVPLSSVAPIMRKAQVAIEDSRFYEHGGLDTRGLVRAIVSSSQGTVQGGPSLTQQYVKLLLTETALKKGDKEAAAAAQTQKGYEAVTRKLQELKYSIQLEKTLSKDQILQGYFNISYYGDQAYGVEAASRHYFGHSAKTLTLVEAATLAGLTQNPGTTDPVHFPTKAQSRRNLVLNRMYELQMISKKDRDAARSTPIAKTLKVTPAVSSCAAAGNNAYFCEYAKNYLLNDPSLVALGKTKAEREEKLYSGGLTIKTTLEPAMAAMMRDQIVQRVPVGNDNRGIHVGSAAVSIDPNTGAVRGTAQNSTYSAGASSDWSKTSINWAVDQQYGGSGGFQFGSTAKAFALVTALESGLPMNTVVQAKEANSRNPYTFTTKEFPGGAETCGLQGTSWPRVKNEAAGEGGPRTLSDATARSINTAFIALTQQLGACKVRDTEIKLGLHKSNGQEIPRGPAAIILGATEVSPMTVASAYGVMAAGGKHCTPVPIVSVTDSRGKALNVPKPGTSNCKQVVDPGVAAGVAQIMKATLDSSQRGTAATSALAGGRIAAGKTGTSDGNKQTWFVGYTPQLVTSVWTGTPNSNTDPLDNITLAGQGYPVVYGASISAPIWKGIMDNALANTANADFPAPPQTIQTGNLQPFSPSPLGYSVGNATAILEAQGYKVVVGGTIASNYRPSVVAGTAPRGGAPAGSTVTIFTSSGPAPGTGRNAGTGTTNANPAATVTPAAAKPATGVKTKPPKG